jgi:hypothetical protein
MNENSGLLRPQQANRLQNVRQNIITNLRQSAGIFGNGINRIGDTISNAINSTGVFEEDSFEVAHENGYIGLSSNENKFNVLENELHDGIFPIAQTVQTIERIRDNGNLPIARPIQEETEEVEEEEKINEDESGQRDRWDTQRYETTEKARQLQSKIKSVHNIDALKLRDIKQFLMLVSRGYMSDKTLIILKDIERYID